MARRVIAACGGSVRGKRIALLGLTFKPNTDDMRDAPSIAIVTALQDAGATIAACDPEGVEQAKALFENVSYAPDPYSCAEGADAVVIVTEWNVYRALDLKRLAAIMKAPVMVDLRNVYRPDEVRAAGFSYASVGRL